MALFEPRAAAPKLIRHLLIEKDGAVRFKVLRALVKLRRSNPELTLDEEPLRRVVDTTLDHAEELRRWGVGLAGAGDDAPPASVAGGDPLQAGHHLLIDLVRDKELHARQRLFMLFELLHGEDFEEIERGLRSRKPKTRASSLELVENLVPAPYRARVVALVGEAAVEGPAPAYERTLAEMLEKGGSTMRTIAEYRAMELGLDVATITGRRPSQAPAIDSLGKRFVDRARDLLAPTDEAPLATSGVSRAPA